MLERGDFDLVAVGRALLQDPLWAQKVRQGRTRRADGLRTLGDGDALLRAARGELAGRRLSAVNPLHPNSPETH